MSSDYLQEANTLILLNTAVAQSSTPTATPYIYAGECDVLELIVLWLVGLGVTTSDRGIVEVVAASDNAGTGLEVVNIDDLFVTTGAATIEDGTGLPVRSRDVGASYTTTTADGTKQIQVVVPVRTRRLPQGKNWVALRLATGGNARSAIYGGIRVREQYAGDTRPTLL